MMMNQPLRVAVCQRVCSHYRAPIYQKLNAEDGVRLKVFHGDDVAGTKFRNARLIAGFEHEQLATLQLAVRSSGRRAPLVICPGLFPALARFQPNVIVTGGGGNFLNNFAVFTYGKLFRVPVIWWTLGMLEGRSYCGTGRLYRRVVRRFERKSDILLGYSTPALDYFRRMGYPEQKCFRAVNSLDTDPIFAAMDQARAEAADLRRQLGLEGKRVVLFVGALDPAKRIDRLLHAFARLRSSFPRTHLLLVGDGPLQPSLKRLSGELGLGDATTFTGRIVEGVAPYFQLGSVFVLPGAGGLAIVEAMAHGLPVICGHGDGTEEDYVLHGETGLRFRNTGDEEVIQEIQSHLAMLFEDEAARRRIGAAAQARIVTKYNGNTYAASIYDAIRAAAQRAAA